MKNREQKVEVKVKPKRVTARDRRRAKRAEKANEQLALCRESAEFHMQYLNAELEAETAKYEALQARIAELQPKTEIVVTEEEETAAADAAQELPEMEEAEEFEEEAIFNEALAE